MYLVGPSVKMIGGRVIATTTTKLHIQTTSPIETTVTRIHPPPRANGNENDLNVGINTLNPTLQKRNSTTLDSMYGIHHVRNGQVTNPPPLQIILQRWQHHRVQIQVCPKPPLRVNLVLWCHGIKGHWLRISTVNWWGGWRMLRGSICCPSLWIWRIWLRFISIFGITVMSRRWLCYCVKERD